MQAATSGGGGGVGGQGQLQNCSYFGDDVLGFVILYLAQAPCLVIPASALLVIES